MRRRPRRKKYKYCNRNTGLYDIELLKTKSKNNFLFFLNDKRVCYKNF